MCSWNKGSSLSDFEKIEKDWKTFYIYYERWDDIENKWTTKIISEEDFFEMFWYWEDIDKLTKDVVKITEEVLK